MFVSDKCVLFFEKSEVIFTKWCFIFVLFFDKSDYDHCKYDLFPDFIWFGTDCRQNKRNVIEHKNISVAVMNMLSGLAFDLPPVTINLVTWMPDAVVFANTRLCV